MHSQNGKGGRPKTTIKFESDYDFEQANNKFEELRLELAKLKVGEEAKPEQVFLFCLQSFYFIYFQKQNKFKINVKLTYSNYSCYYTHPLIIYHHQTKDILKVFNFISPTVFAYYKFLSFYVLGSIFLCLY